MKHEADYGTCSYCGGKLEPVWFIEEEYETGTIGYPVKTGRRRRAVDYLMCPICLHKECVDDTFDGPWHR